MASQDIESLKACARAGIELGPLKILRMRFGDSGYGVESEIDRVLKYHVCPEREGVNRVEDIEPMLDAVGLAARRILRDKIEGGEEARLRADRQKSVDADPIRKAGRAWICQHIDEDDAAHAMPDDDEGAVASLRLGVGLSKRLTDCRADALALVAIFEINEDVSEEQADGWTELAPDSAEAKRRRRVSHAIRNSRDCIPYDTAYAKG
ncbi:hypothetical protein D9M72_101910 [compost metagenome]